MKTYSVRNNKLGMNPFIFNPVHFGRPTKNSFVLERINVTHAIETSDGLLVFGSGNDGKYTQFRLDELVISSDYELGRFNELLKFLKIDANVIDQALSSAEGENHVS